MKRLVVFTFVFLLSGGLLAAGGGAFWLWGTLPSTNTTLEVAVIEQPVEVLRDEVGVPHIFAKSSRDAYFALGFVHAQDRLWPPTVNAVVSREAEQCGVFVNAVDEPENASAYLGSVVRRAGVTFAISTDGRAPALAGLLREGLEAVLPETDLEGWVAEAKKMRQVWRTDSVPIEDRRPQLLRALMKRYEDAHTDGSQGDVSSPHR